MTNSSLAKSYLKKAVARLALLPILQKQGAYSDMVREAQEIVELCLKGMLRQVGVEPPKWHDVGSLLIKHADRFEARIAKKIPGLAEASEWLRAERELCFYGDVDFIPTEEYGPQEGRRAAAAAKLCVQIARSVIVPIRRIKS
jgi:HEPN domain-containing protein